MTPSTQARTSALLYALAALLLAAQAAWFYLIGEHARILLPAALMPVVLTAALMRLGQPETARLSAYLVVMAGYLTVAMELPVPSPQAPFWLGLPPVLTLLLLPLGPATLLNVSLTPIWLLMASDWLSPDLVLGYLCLIAVAGLAPWGGIHQRALLRATDPMDPECNALQCRELHERLLSECERARLLEQRLAVLIIHLPQLEMAGEQFGHAVRLALLETLCESAARVSRAHDMLGRESDTDFWLILPDTGESGATLVRQRLAEALANPAPLDVDAPGVGVLHARFMICQPRRGETPEAFVQRLRIATQRQAATGSE